MLNGVFGQQQPADDADRRDRDREHDDERVAQRLVLRRHHGVDEQDGEDQHELQLLERLRLLLDLGAEADGEVGRHADLAEPRLHGGSTASLSGISISALTRVMRSMFLRSICDRTGLAVDGQQVARRHDLAARAC